MPSRKIVTPDMKVWKYERLLSLCDNDPEFIKEAEMSGMTVEQFRKFTVLCIRNEKNNIKEEEQRRELAKESVQAEDAKRYKNQRNIAAIICIILLASTLFFAFRTDGKHTALFEKQKTVINAALTDKNYVASVNSDKYHISGCTYAENILPGNIVYYTTEADAKAAGKNPCSKCVGD